MIDYEGEWIDTDCRFLSEKIRLGLIENEKLKFLFKEDPDIYFNHYRKLVKYGDYSPANPKFNTGRVLLGFGEYELKRQQMLEQRKQEYKQYLAEVNNKKNYRKYEMPPEEGIYMPYYGGNNLQQQQQPQMYNYGAYDQQPQQLPPSVNLPPPPAVPMPPPPQQVIPSQTQVVAYPSSTTLAPPPPIVNLGNPPPMTFAPPFTKYETVMYAYPPPQSINKDLQLQQQPPTVQVNNIFGSPKRETMPQVNVTEVEMTPRERKIADLKDSGVFEIAERKASLPNIDQFQPSMFNETIISQKKIERHLAYKAELQKQIDEKKRLELEQKERDKLDEKAMQAKIEKQLEIMKMEYEKEEKKRKEKQELMFRRTDHFMKSQEEFKKVPKRPSISLPPTSETSPVPEPKNRVPSPPIPTLMTSRQKPTESYSPAQVVKIENHTSKSATSLVPRSKMSRWADESDKIPTKFSPSASQIYNQGIKAVLSEGDRNTILTQLGSFRKHLEIEQQKMKQPLFNMDSSLIES